jgi:hypothetical protein
MRWAWHVARIREERGIYRVLVGNLRESDHLEDPGLDGRTGLDGRIIFRWIIGSGIWGYGLNRAV